MCMRGPGNDGVNLLIRFLTALSIVASLAVTLTGCGPSYSPDTYANNAAQQAAKVESGVIAGVRPVHISAQGTVGGVAGAAAGGVAGSQVGAGPTSAFAAIGGSLIGGIAGVATEHIVGDTDGFEYIVRKANGDMISVAQKDPKPLLVGQKVLVIAGPQARIVADYTVPFEPPPKLAAKPSPPPSEPHPAATDEPAAHPAAEAAAGAPAGASGGAPPGATPAAPPIAAAPPVPAETVVPPQLPAAFGAQSPAPPPLITPPDVPSAIGQAATPAKP
jgi:outer membrane lipoprotein SlyB